MTIAVARGACVSISPRMRRSTSSPISTRLVVDARDLLRSVTIRTLRWLAAGVAHKRRCDARFPAGVRECRGAIVHAGDGDERRLAAQCGDVVRDVGGPADPEHLVIEGNDWHRRFGKIRVTRPTMNLSSMASPITSTRAVRGAGDRRARSGVTGGSSMRIGSFRGKRQRDDDEEEHQEFRVAEVVFEHAGGQHRRKSGERTRGQHAVLERGRSEDADGEHADEREPRRECRQASFSGDLNRHVAGFTFCTPVGSRYCV